VNASSGRRWGSMNIDSLFTYGTLHDFHPLTVSNQSND